MKKITLIALILGLLSSCEESFLETTPTTSVSSSSILASVGNAEASINGIHRMLYQQWESSQDMGGYAGMMIAMDAMGEDLVFPINQWYSNSVYRWTVHRNVNALWDFYPYDFMYQVINNANIVINGIDGIAGVQKDKDRVKAEALTYRAWAHFFLVQLYAKRYVPGAANTQLGVPLMLKSSTVPQPRATVEEVYAQVNKDLDDAIVLFAGTAERANKSHFNANVANGIKARVLLTQGNWIAAATAAAAARSGYSLMSNAEYKAGFNSATNPEWIWGSIMSADQTIYFYSYFAFMSYNFNAGAVRTCPKCINSLLYAKISATDVRKGLWHPTEKTGTVKEVVLPTASFTRYNYMNTKFAVVDYTSSVGDVVMMRAAEMYLIEAEAYARAGQDGKAQDALYTLVVNRNPSYVKSTSTGQTLIDEIMVQRRVELWGEGFRFLDLKRLNLPLDRTGANHVVAQMNVATVPVGDKLWQWLIPQKEMDTNPVMVQNEL
ncbi:RagB/SusD domain protein [Paludibacter propionicigenes WB4]|uniref:RagB/SusD domain protein n=1 Tax=Paludibacter propionicigenes (strain DSM 17365 / JCM 13257 / WB4) TaxID=694427 RepID=E4T6X9_PALPW|nr:RagB/SusD family nutrient uptake outer membrane protein [Paludibacter propionicigenes]ADQ80473.1 RagB/SusD domain protein [Paludibacter propionicigenes WB4]